jgi:flagellar basal-body rod modification protein FlgD
MTAIGSTSLSQAAEQAAALAATQAAAASSSTGTSAAGAASATAANALQSLGTNFNQFLSLLTTQLKNQDPTQPMDTNQFTQELVQFTGVQQSVATNTNLSQLIALQQGSEVLQSAQVAGHTATITASQISLQKSTGELTYQTTQAEPIQIAIANSAGQIVKDVTLTSTAGANTWQWDGTDNSGNKLPDGAYGVAVETGTDNNATAIPFSVVGTATGITNSASGLQLQMGAVSVGLQNVQSIESK